MDKEGFGLAPGVNAGTLATMFDDEYKLRHEKIKRRRWEAAATLLGLDLAKRMRRRLDEAADCDLRESSK
jgi:hypothetical protein